MSTEAVREYNVETSDRMREGMVDTCKQLIPHLKEIEKILSESAVIGYTHFYVGSDGYISADFGGNKWAMKRFGTDGAFRLCMEWEEDLEEGGEKNVGTK